MSFKLVRGATAWVLLAVLCLGVVIPVALGCVIPRDLAKQLQLAGDEIVVGTVERVHEVWAPDVEGNDALFTRVELRVQDAWRSGQKTGTIQLFFQGGVSPGADRTTVTPAADDFQVGRQLLLFLADREFGPERFGPDVYQLDSYAECYRIQTVRSRRGNRELVVGKGDGFAFETNILLADARERVQRLLKKR